MRKLLLAVTFAAGALLVPVTAADAARCAKPAHVSFTRKPGSTSGRLTWQPPKHAARGTRYRVWRGGTVVGQTKHSSMKVRVSVGHRYRFAVAAVSPRGAVMHCRAHVRANVAYAPPGVPPDLAIEGTSNAALVHLSWEPAQRGDAKLTGYRVRRSGATYKQTSATGIDVPIANDRTYQFTVAAVDVHGRLSKESPPVTMDSGHLPPSVPQNVVASDISDTELTLSWAPSTAARGTIAAYRIYRDGKVLRQVKGLATRITNLAAASSHVFTVAAVDSSGWMSARSAPATVSTAPPVRSNGSAQAFLLASTDRSFADFRAHYTQIGVVYPTYFDCSYGDAGFVDHHNDQITQWAQQRGVKVLPRLNCQSSDTLSRILKQAEVSLDDFLAAL